MPTANITATGGAIAIYAHLGPNFTSPYKASTDGSDISDLSPSRFKPFQPQNPLGSQLVAFISRLNSSQTGHVALLPLLVEHGTTFHPFEDANVTINIAGYKVFTCVLSFFYTRTQSNC